MRDVWAHDEDTALNDLVALELSPELEAALQNGTLQFKAAADESYVCTADATYRLSGSTCNPTICLMEGQQDSGDLVLTKAVKTMLDAAKVTPHVEFAHVPVYSMDGLAGELRFETLQQRSFCSVAEFDALWRARGGVVVAGNACIAADDLVHRLAIELNTAAFETSSAGFDETWAATSQSYPQELYASVYERFWGTHGTPTPGTLEKWIGCFLLNAAGQISQAEFLARWKRELLGRSPSIDLIKGHYIESGFDLVAVNRATLSTDPRSRLRELFALQHSWDLRQLLPFFSDLIDTAESRAAETYLKQYAKIVNTGDPAQKGRIIKRVYI